MTRKFDGGLRLRLLRESSETTYREELVKGLPQRWAPMTAAVTRQRALERREILHTALEM